MKTITTHDDNDESVFLNNHKIVENRRCHLCENNQYIEKTYNSETKTTSYRCTNCDNIIWVEKELDYEMFPEQFFNEFEIILKETTGGK